jgi:hypothetical protein
MAQKKGVIATNRTLSLEQAVGQKLMLIFRGKKRLPKGLSLLIKQAQPAGFVLFKAFNIQHPEQVRQHTCRGFSS